MIIIEQNIQLQALLSAHKCKTIGFVPTMGALHEGHLSLMKRAKQCSDIVVVSVFVNPTQFNDKSDFELYPRDLERDSKLLDSVLSSDDILFAPSVNEVYPQKDERQFNFGLIGEVMEGKHRPGHFNGVAQVVSRLFDIVKPNKAFFGEKDFQQLAIIKEMTQQLKYAIEITPCPIVREADGLAMSSRNERLNPTERKSAVKISQALFAAVINYKTKSIEELKEQVISEINSDANLSVEYFELVNADTLESVSSWSETVPTIGCIAVYCGKVRLIDNIKFNY